MRLILITLLIIINAISENSRIECQKTNDKQPKFNIGSLLPEINNLIRFRNFSSPTSQISNECNNDDLSASNAIEFATVKLSELFLKHYGCSINLNPADTKVIEINIQRYY